MQRLYNIKIMFPFSLNDLKNKFTKEIYPASVTITNDTALWMHRTSNGKRLALLAKKDHRWHSLFHGDADSFRESFVLKLCPTDHANAYTLQTVLPNVKPAPLGLSVSAGCGDRLGMATPGHARVFANTNVLPIFAQQSIREMTRTKRTPQDVMCDATWGAFESGWHAAVGADADHLKVPADSDSCAAAGFTFYTIDPGAHVDSEADAATPAQLQTKVAALRWNDLESSITNLQSLYQDKTFDLEDRKIKLDAAVLMRALAKYGNAIAHVTQMYRHLKSKGVPFELEVSVDETETPTTHAEHIFIASELKRLGVKWISLAPRYVGRFEKGVDYIGDLKELENDLDVHAQIARVFGPYKLSLHSGSDKFSVYPLIVKATKGVVHLKTAGTSYLEALRVIASVDAKFFREIAALGYERYPTDRASYHVSAELRRAPVLKNLADAQLPSLLDQFDSREILHVTYGSALEKWGGQLKEVVRANENLYYEFLEKHFVKHLKPFAS